MNSARKIYWLIISAVITLLVVIIVGDIVRAWFTVPKAYIWVDDGCNGILRLDESTRFNPQIKNLGEAPAFVSKCISSEEFFVHGGINHTKLCSDWVDLHQQTSETKWALPATWDLLPDKNITEKVQNVTINIEILCKQNIWFFERKCSSNIYTCRYSKQGSNFILINS